MYLYWRLSSILPSFKESLNMKISSSKFAFFFYLCFLYKLCKHFGFSHFLYVIVAKCVCDKRRIMW